MNKWLMRVGVVVMVVVMAFGVIGSAAAQGPDGDQPDQPGQPLRDRIGPNVGGQLMDAIIEATGLTREEIAAELRSGKTFADILAENGIDQQVVIDAVTAVVTDRVNEALVNGNLDEEQAAQILDRLPEVIDTALNAAMNRTPVRQQVANRFDAAMLQVLAEMAGMEPGEVLRDAFSPPSLADIATELGLDPTAIIAEAEARITQQVNEALAAGTITEEQAAQILDGLNERLTERFNSPIRLPQQRDNRDGNGPNNNPGRGPGNNGNPSAPNTDGDV